MVVGDQIAGAVGGLPVTPESESETIPAHPGEVGHVLVNHPLAIALDVTRCTVVGRRGQHVVRAEEGDLLAIITPADHPLLIQVDRAFGDCALSLRRYGVCGEKTRRQKGSAKAQHGDTENTKFARNPQRSFLPFSVRLRVFRGSVVRNCSCRGSCCG
jgi:hypothetical protein